eukprot:SAG22_NODE_609_length_8597_cov_12.875382_5_plen_197_part_00
MYTPVALHDIITLTRRKAAAAAAAAARPPPPPPMPKHAKKSGPPVILTEEQKLEIVEAFALFDAEGSGSISINDLLVTMRAMGFEPTQGELQKMVVAAGADRQATGVTLEQFTRVLTDKMEEESSVEDLAQAFRLFEPTDGMVITPQDLARISAQLGENMTKEELGEMIEEADVDGSNVITQEEFIRITSLRSSIK